MLSSSIIPIWQKPATSPTLCLWALQRAGRLETKISKLYLKFSNSCSWPAYFLTSHLFLCIHQIVMVLLSANLLKSSSSRTNSVLFFPVNIQIEIRCCSNCSDTYLLRNQDWWLEGDINFRSANCFSSSGKLLKSYDNLKGCINRQKGNHINLKHAWDILSLK